MITLLDEAVKNKKFDSRVIERNLDRGVIKRNEMQAITKALPDDAANAEYITLEEIAKSSGK